MCNVVFSVIQQKQALGLKLSLLPVEPSTSMAALLCSALVSLAPESQLSATALAGFISLSPLLRRVVSCRPSLHRRGRKERGLRRHYTKHPSEAIISYDSSHAYSRTLSPVGPLSNLIVSAPTPPSRANTRRRGSALDVDLCFFLFAAGAHVDSRSLHYMALVSPCSRFAPHVS